MFDKLNGLQRRMHGLIDILYTCTFLYILKSKTVVLRVIFVESIGSDYTIVEFPILYVILTRTSHL